HRPLVAAADLDLVAVAEDDRPEAVPLRLVELVGRDLGDGLGEHGRNRGHHGQVHPTIVAAGPDSSRRESAPEPVQVAEQDDLGTVVDGSSRYSSSVSPSSLGRSEVLQCQSSWSTSSFVQPGPMRRRQRSPGHVGSGSCPGSPPTSWKPPGAAPSPMWSPAPVIRRSGCSSPASTRAWCPPPRDTTSRARATAS